MVGRQPFPYRVEGGVDGAGDNSRHILQHESVGRVHEVGGVSLHQQPTTNITCYLRIHRIRMFLDLLDPDPDPSIIKQNY